MRSEAGVVRSTDFVALIHHAATGKAFPASPAAEAWWQGAWKPPGFIRVPAGSGSFPVAGDLVILEDGHAGHVALVVGVALPQEGQSGFALVAQAQATHVLEVWTLAPDGTLTPPWSYPTHVPGYLRLSTPGTATVASRVQPILQWDPEAGYDSRTQRDVYWNSVCSAAAFTEVARAWGITSVTLGQAIDRLLAHRPPYLSAADGLLDQAGWSWLAEAYQLRAQVAWGAYTYESLIQQVTTTGIPMIIGIRGGSQGRVWGHFLVVVGGDSTHARVVDSSLWRLQSLPRSVFFGPTVGVLDQPIWWSGETVLLTPE